MSAHSPKTNSSAQNGLHVMRRVATQSALVLASLLSTTSLGFAVDAGALPHGGTVASGDATFDYSATQPRLDINQTSLRTVIDWQGFNIGEQAITNFNQAQGAGSVAVNRVHDANPSQILGTLTANGNVVVLNQNGVFFGNNAKVDVAGLIVSTGEIDANAFQNDGAVKLSNINANKDAAIINKGSISVKQGGLAAFVAPNVVNDGVIAARLGKVAIGAGADKATVDLYGDGLVELTLDDKASKAFIENNGQIKADGGTIVVTAAAAKDIADSVINMGGVVEANSVGMKNGKIILGATNADIKVSGVVNASGKNKGGQIKITADNIETTSSSILIADATENGDAGTIEAIARQNMLFRGSAYARGGLAGGNGGFVEVSGYKGLGYEGSVDTSAAKGAAGSFLLDPAVAIIHSGWLDPLGWIQLVIKAENLANDLHRNGTVTVEATNSIEVGTNLLFPGIGNGEIDLSSYHYQFLNTHGSVLPWHWTIDTASGTNNNPGNLVLKSDTVNFNKDLIMGTGSLDVQANTVNLNARLYDYDLGSKQLMDQSDITTSANTVNVLTNAALIQQGIYLVAPTGTVNVGDGTYNENLSIAKSLKLQSVNGRAATKIEGIAGAGSNGTIVVENGVSDVQIGDAGKGFHIVGFDNGAPGIEQASVYLLGGNNNVTIKDNEIEAKGDLALLTNYGQAYDNLVIDGNEFSGQTFVGATPGSGSQFVDPNVPRALVFINNGAVTNTQFTNNKITGTTGGTDAGGNYVGNVLVNIDSAGADVTGNEFDGHMASIALRVRGSDIVVANNSIDGNGSGVGIYAQNVTNLKIGGDTAAEANVINNTGGAAIAVQGGSNATVKKNSIGLLGGAGNIKGDGIYANAAQGIQILENDIANTQTSIADSGSGIQVVNTDAAVISGNKIANSGWDGIRLQNSSNLTLQGNTIDTVARVGIWGGNIASAYIVSNTVMNDNLSGYGSIHADGGSNWTVLANDIDHGDYGIRLNGTTGKNIIRSNKVDNVTADAIYVENVNGNTSHTTGVDIESNQIGQNGGHVAGNGVTAINSANARAMKNTIAAAQKGIYGDNVKNMHVYENKISSAKVAGIHIANSHGTSHPGDDVDIWSNVIANGTGATGILIENSNYASIGYHSSNPFVTTANAKNTITGGKNGIVIKDTNYAYVSHNVISGQVGSGDGPASGDGIYMTNSKNAEILYNTISNVSDEGIQGDNADNARVDHNTITNARGAGISLMRGSDNQTITNNTITNTRHSGIFSSGKGTLTITGNTINTVGTHSSGNNYRNDGIHVDSAFANEGNANPGVAFAGGGLIDNNTINGFTGAGIELANVDSGLVVSNNTIGTTTAGPVGIYNNGSDETVIEKNTIANIGTGVLVTSSKDIKLVDNTINDANDLGVYVKGAGNGLITLADNKVNNAANAGAKFESGLIDLTGTANVFNGGAIGLLFDLQDAPLALTLKNNTIGETKFIGQTDEYVRLANGAFFEPGTPTVLNGYDATFDGKKVATMTGGEYYALLGKIWDYNDDNKLGLFFPLIGSDITDILPEQSLAAYNLFRNPLLTILGLPYAPGVMPQQAGLTAQGFSAAALNSIATAAGGEANDNVASIASALNNVEPTAGETTVGCWGQVYNSMNSGLLTPVTYSFNANPFIQLTDQTNCGSSAGL